MSILCKHDWLKQSEVILPSAYEQLHAGGEELNKLRGDAIHFFQKTHILVLICSECGKIYKSIVKNLKDGD